MAYDVQTVELAEGARSVALRRHGNTVLKEVVSIETDWSWESAIERLDFAFQPIVNIHNGVCFGYEALLRNWREAGFSSIQSVFDAASDDMILYQVESALRAKAIRKFATIRGGESMKLFYNPRTNRCLDFGVGQSDDTARVLEQSHLPPGILFLEVSERHDPGAGIRPGAGLGGPIAARATSWCSTITGSGSRS